MRTNKDKQWHPFPLYTILLILCILLFCTYGVYYTYYYEKPQYEYNMKEEEDDKEKIEMQTPEVTQSPAPEDDSKGYVEIAASPEVTIHLDDKTADVFFQNPTATNQDIALQLYVEDSLVAETDILPPGYQVSILRNLDTSTLETGSCTGKFVIQVYDPETGEKQIVNSELEVNVMVVD